MIWLLISFINSFSLKGKWEGILTSNRDEKILFLMRSRFLKGKYICQLISNKTHEFLPKKINIKELKEDKHYALIIPSKQHPKFAELFFKQEEFGNKLTSNVNSSDLIWNTTVNVIPFESIEMIIQKNGKSQWIKYSLRFLPPKEQRFHFALGFSIFIIIIILSFIYSLFSKKKNKTE